jgi:hypothetical protein
MLSGEAEERRKRVRRDSNYRNPLTAGVERSILGRVNAEETADREMTEIRPLDINKITNPDPGHPVGEAARPRT